MRDMNTLKDRVKCIRKGTGLSQAAFGRLLGVSRSAIAQLEDGSTKTMKSTTLVAVERKTGYSASWVQTGRGKEKLRDARAPDDVERIYSALMELPPEHRRKIEAEIDFLLSLSAGPVSGDK